MVAQPAVGDAIEAYWPDDDEWLGATLSAVKADGTCVIVWDADGSSSEVTNDYVRPLGGASAMEEIAEVQEEADNENVDDAVGEEAPAVSNDMDALMAAAMAAGACDEADGFVAGNKPPCDLHWAKVLQKTGEQEEPDAERKRCRPEGLMSSQQAREAALAKKAKS
mmetsp:Transcript_108408/g.305700  ORF Transcript_108408/g.305700 Transcript_108408/m.305700 type:complete len:166 (+) Transcript_108408:47-544(+)